MTQLKDVSKGDRASCHGSLFMYVLCFRLAGCHEGHKYCTFETKDAIAVTVFAIWSLEY